MPNFLPLEIGLFCKSEWVGINPCIQSRVWTSKFDKDFPSSPSKMIAEAAPKALPPLYILLQNPHLQIHPSYMNFPFESGIQAFSLRPCTPWGKPSSLDLQRRIPCPSTIHPWENQPWWPLQQPENNRHFLSLVPWGALLSFATDC